jgi:carboxyl-terminal processing protease
MNKKTKIFVSLFLVSIFLLGIYIGAYGKRTAQGGESKEIYEYLRTFSDVIDLVKRNYVEDVKDKEIVYAAIKGHSFPPICTRKCRPIPRVSSAGSASR